MNLGRVGTKVDTVLNFFVNTTKFLLNLFVVRYLPTASNYKM